VLFTIPVRLTTPLEVSTLIANALTMGSPSRPVFTFVVMAVSSMTSPVLRCSGVAAHPVINPTAMSMIIQP
jgi:hypothetical protein